jgi:hypothetical protein
VQAYYGVVPLILVIPHTFGRRLNFHPHLHILVSAGGLDTGENRWINFRHFDKYALMYWWRFAVSKYLAQVLETDEENVDIPDETFQRQGRRPWNIHIKRFSSKSHFLRYAGRYLRRPPIAGHRIIDVTRGTSTVQVDFGLIMLTTLLCAARLAGGQRLRVGVESHLCGSVPQ